MRVLAIETSCDDTAVAVLSDGVVAAERVVTQTEHARYLGVVPEIASRAHLEVLFPLIDETLEAAGPRLSEIEGIAVTRGPGLIGCLLVGVAAAKGLAHARGIPVVGVNHVEAHLTSAFLEHDVRFPFVGLVVSGGHTDLFHVRGVREGDLLGATRDDAAGEAFDKVAKILGLGFPGGPAIDRIARAGDPAFVAFPRAMMRPEDGCELSFSGLKTAVRAFVAARAAPMDEAFRADVAASFQAAVVDALVTKLGRAVDRTNVRDVVVAGGVACNTALRARLAAFAGDRGVRVHVPSPARCRDNAAMIGHLGTWLLRAGVRGGPELDAEATLSAWVPA